LKPTDIGQPDYFHKVVDSSGPAHTPVPEYIRLIAQGRYSDAYMINWVSNVFGVPGAPATPLRAGTPVAVEEAIQRRACGREREA
jgi:hypothetical protein